MRTREVSVFIDESGSYEHDRQSSRYYLVCMVFHDQDIDITAEIEKLEVALESIGLDRLHCVHAGPLIRREREYAGMNREERRGIFRRMFLFFHNVDVTYKCFVIDKNFLGPNLDVHDSLLQQIIRFLLSRTLELARAKLLSNEGLSESEMVFFGGVKKFKKNYLKLLDRRRID